MVRWLPTVTLVWLCLFSSAAQADYVLFGDGYVPGSNDTYVAADAGACCVGEAPNITNVYLAQTFVATGEKVDGLLLGLANNSYLTSPFQFRLLFAEVEAGFHTTTVLWESKDIVIDETIGGYNEYSFKVSGLKLDVGSQYAWILDTYVTRDGISDTGGFFANMGNAVAPYLDGALFVADATGLGREADFASTWINTGFDAAFLISYKVPEPGSLALLSIGLVGLLIARGRPSLANHATRHLRLSRRRRQRASLLASQTGGEQE